MPKRPQHATRPHPNPLPEGEGANATEINFDGLVGPTHNYAGLSHGNLASMSNKQSVSNPRQAALEGLEKMKFLMDLGVRQAVLPPHERPHMATLRRLGYSGSDGEILAKVQSDDAKLLAAVSSSSAMWAANAATVSPSGDSADQRVHFTPANLVSTLHRSIEASFTSTVLKRIFASDVYFVHHDPLQKNMNLADEGAANHTRLWSPRSRAGLEMFVFGRDGEDPPNVKFPARQTLKASESIAGQHQLDPKFSLFFKQTRGAIDAGAFHNDVVCVGNENVLLIHEAAWEHQPIAIRRISDVFQQFTDEMLHVIEIREEEISLHDSVQTYLFNSQIVTLPDGTMALIAPVESKRNRDVREMIERIIYEPNPLSAVHYVDVRQSMRNGGGPACLRLRVVLNEKEFAAMHPGVILTDALYASLKDWISRHYRESLTPDDLADPQLLSESRSALDELSKLLNLGNVYSFQE